MINSGGLPRGIPQQMAHPMDPRQRNLPPQMPPPQQQQQPQPPFPVPTTQPAPRRSLPVNVEPTFEDLRNMTTTDMAIARYRLRHAYMNEIFDPRSIASIQSSSQSTVKPVDLANIELQAKRLEEETIHLEKTISEKLQTTKDRFDAISRGETITFDQDPESTGDIAMD